MDDQIEKQLAPLRNKVKEQGDKVREMKASGQPEIDIKAEVLKLKARRKELEDLSLKLNPPETFDRNKMANLIKRRNFYDISFSLYGGFSGMYDYGTKGAVTVKNMLSVWDEHFVIREDMAYVDCTVLTPEPVLKASGHVDKFVDFMVKDVVTGECNRLDHLIKMQLEKKLADKNLPQAEKEDINKTLALIEGMTMEEMGALVTKHDMKAPVTGNDLTPPCEFNLMFQISIGPTGACKGYLRPETAQGIFVNFKNLLEERDGRLPFAAAQVGKAYRNEISPRSGLLRVREFLMAEIEHFCYPDDKTHPNFDSVRDVPLVLYSACAQMDGKSAVKITAGEALDGGMIGNQTLGYYIARIQQYLIRIGINGAKLRFRQHLSTEMAHYAADCWDAECLTSYGWVECVGCADRSAFDLECHSKATGKALTVQRNLAVPKEVEVVTPSLDKGLIGRSFKKEAKNVQEQITSMSSEEAAAMEAALSTVGTYFLPGTTHEITRTMVPSIKKSMKKVHVEDITPHVIEPSFGVGRVFYALLEHTFNVRPDDENRAYFSLPAIVAPVKVAVLPLSAHKDFSPFTRDIALGLREARLTSKVDDSTASIGRRYARSDEMGIPYGITVDFDSVSQKTVTLRERDSTEQVRLPISDVTPTLAALVADKLSWADVAQKYPKFTQQEASK